MTGSCSALGPIGPKRYISASNHAVIFYHKEVDYSSLNIRIDVLYIIYLCGGVSGFGFFTRHGKHNFDRLQFDVRTVVRALSGVRTNMPSPVPGKRGRGVSRHAGNGVSQDGKAYEVSSKADIGTQLHYPCLSDKRKAAAPKGGRDAKVSVVQSTLSPPSCGRELRRRRKRWQGCQGRSG